MNKLNHITKEQFTAAYSLAITKLAIKHGTWPKEVVENLYNPIFTTMLDELFPKPEIKANCGDLIEFDDVSNGKKVMAGGPRYYMVINLPDDMKALINIKTGGLLEGVDKSVQKIIDKSWLKDNNRVRVISNSEYNKTIKF